MRVRPAAPGFADRAEDALSRAAVARANAGLVQTDADGRMRLVNARWCEMLGYAEAELLGRALSDVTAPASQGPMREAVARLAAGGPDFVAETHYRRPDGSEVPTTSSVSALRAADGTYLGLIAVVFDDSERVHAEQALRASVAHLASLFSLTSLGLAQADPGTRQFVRVNAALSRLTGYAEAELLAMTVDELNHPGDRARDREAFERLVGGESSYEIEKRYVRKDGTVVWVHVTGSVVRGADGRPARVFAVIEDITLRKRLEEERLEALAQLDALSRHAPIGIALFDTDLRFVELNDRAAEAHGVPKMAHLGRLVSEVLPGFGAQLEVPLRQVRETGQPLLGLEVTGETPAAPGEQRTWNASFFPVHDPSGQLIGVGLVTLEITASRRAEVALRASEERFRMIVESAEDFAIITLDSHGRITGWNSGAEKMLGYSEEEVIGRDGSLIFTPEDIRRGGPEWEVRTALAEGRAIDERWHVRKDGSRFWGSGLMMTLKHEGEGAPGLVKIMRDRTAARLADERLRDSEQQFRRAIQDAPIPVILHTEDGEVLQVNGAWTALTGYTLADMPTVDAWLHHTNDFGADAVRGAVRHVLANEGIPLGPIEVSLTTHAGETRHWLLSTAAPGVLRDGRRFVVSMAQDITERKRDETALRRSEEALRDADRRKDEFLATLAHELRNPLAPVRSSIQVLRMAGEDPVARDRVVEVMERQVSHMVRLVDDLLEVSRITRGMIELRTEIVALQDVVRSAVETAAPLVETAGHDLSVSVPNTRIMLAGDPIRLAQVVTNLLNNAAKYTPAGGRIWLAARREGDTAVIAVRDTGIGIPTDLIPRIFDLFTQGDRSLTRAQGGLGIGLTLVKRLVELHRGTVEARSEGPGTGAEFIVRLPTAHGPV